MESGWERKAKKLAVVLLRYLEDRSQREFEAASGVDQARISRYERGKVQPSRPTLERMAESAGVSSARLEQLLALLSRIAEESAAHHAREGAERTGVRPETREEDLREVAARIAAGLEPKILAVLQEMQAILDAPPAPLEPEEAREDARRLWGRLAGLSDRQRRLVVEHGKEYQSWALCERICEESRSASQSDPARGLELAELALAVAERTPGGNGSRKRLEGYAWGFVGRAREAVGDPEGTEQAFRRARELWLGGELSALEPLDEDRWPGRSEAPQPN